MKIIQNKIIPFPGFKAINLFGVLFTRKHPDTLGEVVINHEEIHTAQMKELGYILFYIIYFIEWVCNLVWWQNSKAAYRFISFEQEAYKNESNTEYLKTRKHYAQWRNS